MLDEILEKCKSQGDKKGLDYISKTKTSTSGGIVLVKSKEETPNQETSSSLSLFTHYKKSEYTQSRCHTRFLESYESQLNRLVNEFKSLKNNILNTMRGKKTNTELKTQQSSSESPPKTSVDEKR